MARRWFTGSLRKAAWLLLLAALPLLSGCGGDDSSTATTSSGSNTAVNNGTGFAVPAPVPASVSPLSGISTGGTSVTVTGTGFRTGAAVSIGGSTCVSPNVASPTQILCSTGGHPAGAANVVVTNPDNQTGTLASGYIYNAASAPTASAIAPANGPSAGGTSVTITGTGLAAGAAVYLGGATPCANVVVSGSTSLSCVAPAHAVGLVNVVVVNSDNQSTTMTNAYNYKAPFPSAISPIAGNDGGGTSVTITGQYFASTGSSNASVSIGGAGCNNVTVVSPTQITCQTTAHVVQSNVNVVVTNPDTVAGTLVGGYTYRKAPLVSAIAPANGPIAGGTAVTITGNYFVAGASVSIGAAPCASVSVPSATQITCTTGSSGGSGNSAVIVTNVDPQSSNSNVNYYYYAPLSVAAASYTIAINGSFAFSNVVSGGVPPYSFSLGASPAGAITAGGNYTAPAAPGGPDTVNVSDSAAVINSTSATIKTVKPTKVGLGYTSSCAVMNEGTLKCWGGNASGQLGLGDVQLRGNTSGTMGAILPPVAVGAAVADVAGGQSHTCARTTGGQVKCWGANASGQLGQGSTTSAGDGVGTSMGSLPFVNLGSGRTATQVAVGGNHVCAVLDNSTVKCWGLNSTGQLGYNDTANRGTAFSNIGDSLPAVTFPTIAPTGFTPAAVAAGDAHSCAMDTVGRVLCWGKNNAGQLGQDNTTNIGDTGTSTVAGASVINLGTGRTATSITAGGNMTCAKLDNGTVKCWGSNGYGQLGLNSTTSQGNTAGSMAALSTISFPGGSTVLGIFAAATQPGAASEGELACALLSISAANATICWGLGGSGQLGQYSTANAGDGIGTSVSALPSITLGTGRTPQQVTAGGAHSCAVLDNSTVKCWGLNSSGQLGQENTTNRGDSAVATPNDHRMGDNLPAIKL